MASIISRFRDQFRPVTGPGCKSGARQLAEVLQLGSRYRFTPREYVLYRFYEEGKSIPDMLQFMTNWDVSHRYRPRLNDTRWVPILGNKWLFNVYYRKFGVPVTNVHGYYDRQSGLLADGRPLTSPDQLRRFLLDTRPETLVVKPVGGLTAKGVIVFTKTDYAGPMAFEAINGLTMDFEQLAAHLSEQPEGLIYDGFLLEEKLTQHPFMEEINPYNINTYRVVTFMDAHGEVDIHFVILRLGKKGNPTDAWNKGGLSVYVDPKTGRLGKGVLKPQHGGQWTDTHPDTGVVFEGRTVPMWDQVVAATTRAQSVSPHLKAIGWDVVLTPDGPVIIEGNHNWDLLMVQVHGAYLRPEIRTKLAEYGLEFPR